MKKLSPRTKLNEEQKNAVVKMFGAMMSIAEVQRNMKEVYGVETDYNLLYGYKNKMVGVTRALQLDKERAKYLADLKEVPIFHPKVRFQRAEDLFNKGLKEDDSEQMASALRLAQNEFKEKIAGDTINVWNQNNQFNMEMSMEEIADRKRIIFDKLKKKELLNGPSGQAGKDIVK